MSEAIFFRLLSENVENKADALEANVAALNTGNVGNGVFIVADTAFEKITGSPFAYWVSDTFRHLFDLPKVGDVATTNG